MVYEHKDPTKMISGIPLALGLGTNYPRSKIYNNLMPETLLSARIKSKQRDDEGLRCTMGPSKNASIT